MTTTILEQLDGASVVRVRVDQPLDRVAPDFTDDLVFNLSLLREVCDDAHVFPADMTEQEYINIQHVAWDLLPPGALGRVIERVRAKSAANPARSAVAEERLRALDRLKPEGFIQGNGQFSSYFGALFGKNIAALENLDYGNALYLFEADWERLSQLSRTELVKRRDAGVHRVQHRPGWQPIVRSLIRKAQKGSRPDIA